MNRSQVRLWLSDVQFCPHYSKMINCCLLWCKVLVCSSWWKSFQLKLIVKPVIRCWRFRGEIVEDHENWKVGSFEIERQIENWVFRFVWYQYLLCMCCGLRVIKNEGMCNPQNLQLPPKESKHQYFKKKFFCIGFLCQFVPCKWYRHFKKKWKTCTPYYLAGQKFIYNNRS